MRSALDAGLPVVVTQSTYTEGEDFSGAVAVLSDLGEPGRPFTLRHGAAHARQYVGAELLRAWAGETPARLLAGVQAR